MLNRGLLVDPNDTQRFAEVVIDDLLAGCALAGFLGGRG
jgi:hypothetical protein